MKNKKGFTIVELVIVIAVIAILAAVLIPTFTTVTANARASAAQSQAKNAQESVLGNTEGTMPENTLFAISNDNDSRAEYFFVIKERKLENVKIENLGGETPHAYPAKSGTETFGTGEDAYTADVYNVFVTADRFGDAAELGTTKLASITSNVDGLLKDVLDYRYTTIKSEKDSAPAAAGWLAVTGDSHNATETANSNPAAVSDYAVWHYSVDGTKVSAVLHVYYNGDLADTCVVFLAN